MADDLDDLADTLNDLFERAETLFAKLRVAGSIPVDGGDFLFKKHGKAWRLMWQKEGCEPSPLASLGRGVRVKLAAKIPELHTMLLRGNSLTGAEMGTAIADLGSYLEKHNG